MAKFCYASDLHLEFGPLTINNTENADCLILAGDVVEAIELTVKSELSYTHIDDFFKNISDQFETVVWVAGNHEFYGSSMQRAPKIIKNYLEQHNIGNIKFLQNETIVVKGVPIHCGTLWTNMRNLDQLVMYQATVDMNDYSKIQNQVGEIDVLLRPVHTVQEHQRTMQFLDSAIKEKCIVVTHHAPLYACLQYSNGNFGYYYASNLENFILDHPQIEYWIHGHLHTRKDIDILDTKVTSNCRGYKGYESMANSFQPKYFEVN